jgi:hypothetical protein
MRISLIFLGVISVCPALAQTSDHENIRARLDRVVAEEKARDGCLYREIDRRMREDSGALLDELAKSVAHLCSQAIRAHLLNEGAASQDHLKELAAWDELGAQERAYKIAAKRRKDGAERPYKAK